MSKLKIVQGEFIDEEYVISQVEICARYSFEADELRDWIEHGLFPELDNVFTEVKYTQSMVNRLLQAQRLQRDLRVNVQGVVLALELMDEIKRLKQQVASKV